MTAPKGSITRDGDYIVIRLPVSEVQSLRVALHPIRAGETTSNSTQSIRDRLDRGLARAMAPKQKAEA